MRPSTRGQRQPLATLTALLLLVAASSRCVTDHDALAKKNRRGSGGSAGSGGKGGSGGFGAASSGGDAGDDKYHETPGRNVVTFLNGVVDAERAAFCFARVVDGQREFVGEPMPEGGLAFARSFAVESIDGIDLETDALSTFVLGGDLALVEGLDCEAAVAEAERLMAEAMPEEPVPGGAGAGGAGGAGGANDDAAGAGGVAAGGTPGGGGADPGAGGVPGAGGFITFAQEITAGAGGASSAPLPDAPGLQVHELPLLPPATLSGGYSFLFAAAGCIGGPWHRHEQEDLICGEGYNGDPTLVPVLVTMSREVSSRLSLQALHASRGAGGFDLRVSPPEGSADPQLYIARDLIQGVIAPRPPASEYSALEYGVSLRGHAIEIVNDGSIRLAESWDQILDRSSLDTLENGQSYTLVVVGARPGLGIAEWWNKGAITVVPAEP